jgi:hypothetical protein
MLEIPIWFPEADPEDPAVTAFWKAFPKDEVTQVTPQMRTTFEQAIALRVGLGNKSLRVEQFSTLTSTNSRQRWAPREWQREAGFCCLVFRFYFKDDSALTKKPLTISYRQPLIHADRGGRFFYLPVFQNLPKGASTADTNRYAITIAAHPGCSLVVTSGDQKFAVEAGHSIALSPRHYQPIRALAKTRSNKSVETKPDGARLNQVEVVRIAREAATKHGYHVADYKDPQAHYEFTRKDKTWTVFYGGKVPAVGNHFLVWVDDQTGVAEVMPGE